MLFKFSTVLYIRTFHFECLLFLRFALIFTVTSVSHPALKKYLLIFFPFSSFSDVGGSSVLEKETMDGESVGEGNAWTCFLDNPRISQRALAVHEQTTSLPLAFSVFGVVYGKRSMYPRMMRGWVTEIS